MPKENTHAAFAYDVLDSLSEETIRRGLSAHLGPYLLGSISPDTFYYSPYSAVSEHLHGKAGNPTNELLPDLLPASRTPRDVAFACGYLSHCALDITFHPVIYFLSGNYYDPDARLRARAVYLHRHLETCLDMALGNRLRIHALFKPEMVEGLAYESYVAGTFSLPPSGIRKAYRTQLRYNRAFASQAAYTLARVLTALGAPLDPNARGLFYGDCRADTLELFSGPIAYRDLISGREYASAVPALLWSARDKAVGMIRAVWSYLTGAMDMDELLGVIPGESLDTGRVHAPVDGIRHLKG